MTAVARPDDFRENVASMLGRAVELLAFADHHEYADADVRRIVREASGRAVVVTQKDAVKLAPRADQLPDTLVLTQRRVWEPGREGLDMRLGGAAEGRP